MARTPPRDPKRTPPIPASAEQLPESARDTENAQPVDQGRVPSVRSRDEANIETDDVLPNDEEEQSIADNPAGEEVRFGEVPKRPETNPAQVRGDVQHGLTGDKTRGFDPAAAPLETDDEAGGVPLTAEAAQNARAGQLRGTQVDTSTEYSNAMRPLSEAEKIDPFRQWFWLVLPIVGIAVVLGALVYVAIAGSS